MNVLSYHHVFADKTSSYAFDGAWYKLVGAPEVGASWLVWGESGSGKTSLMLSLCKYYTRFARVLLTPLETGISGALKNAMVRAEMDQVKDRFSVMPSRSSMEDVAARLRKKGKSKFDVVLIDSLQYTGWNAKKYYDFCEEFPRVTKIFISHADGKNPDGSLGKKARYHADVKVRIEGFTAFAESRYAESLPVPLCFYEAGAKEYWGLNFGEYKGKVKEWSIIK